jgi:SAM-dependent methyltransferase
VGKKDQNKRDTWRRIRKFLQSQGMVENPEDLESAIVNGLPPDELMEFYELFEMGRYGIEHDDEQDVRFHELLVPVWGIFYGQALNTDAKTLGCISEYMRTAIDRSPSEIVVDAGCGTGIDVCYFARHHSKTDFVAYDRAPKVIAAARERVSKLLCSNVRVESGDHITMGERLSSQASLVYSKNGSQLSVPKDEDDAERGQFDPRMIQAVIRPLFRMLAPGGTLLTASCLNRYAFELVRDALAEEGIAASAALSVGSVDLPGSPRGDAIHPTLVAYRSL